VVDSDESLVVWHRPAKGASSGGSSHIVTSALIRDRGAVLTSRRPK
jgi:hypothetical protein